jgi:hypothetical protein
MPALRVMVVRYDDKIITEMTMDVFMTRLIRRFLKTAPDHKWKLWKLFKTKDLKDAEMAEALNAAWKSLKTDLFTVGFKPATWMDE